MSGKKYLAAHLASAAPRLSSNDLTTRFMANQVLRHCFGNGLGKAARSRLSTLRGFRPSGLDRKCDHPDREVFIVADLAPKLFPGNPEAQRQLIDMAWASYAHQCDLQALEAVRPTISALSLTPLAVPA